MPRPLPPAKTFSRAVLKVSSGISSSQTLIVVYFLVYFLVYLVYFLEFGGYTQYMRCSYRTHSQQTGAGLTSGLLWSQRLCKAHWGEVNSGNITEELCAPPSLATARQQHP